MGVGGTPNTPQCTTPSTSIKITTTAFHQYTSDSERCVTFSETSDSQKVMLSLSNGSFRPQYRSDGSLDHVPAEILDLIIAYIYDSSGNHLDSIFPLSRTCRQLRASTYKILFERVVIKADENIIRKQSWAFLQHLVSRPHLLNHIRYLEVRNTVESNNPPNPIEIKSAYIGQKLSRKLLLQCIPRMFALRSLKLYSLSDLTFKILQQIQLIHNIQVSIDLNDIETCLYSSTRSSRLEQLISANPAWTFGLSLPRARLSENPTDLPNLITTTNKLTAINWHDNSSTIHTLTSQRHPLHNLEELHVSSRILEAQDHLLQPSFTPWPSLKRLHVQGDREIQHLLSSVVDKLTSLVDLRLHSSSPVAFHSDCLNPQRTTPTTPFPWTSLPSLQHLSLRGICPHIRIQHITTPHLRTLALILPEYTARINNQRETRPASDLLYLSTHLPHLTHLELHVGPVEKLWNPTAIPVVDVDMSVYTFLHRLTQIKTLQTLRLFPPYVPSSRRRSYLNAQQPLSDEQAIKLWHYLHGFLPGLHTLSVAATFAELRTFKPMSWLVRDGGGSAVVMSTRQAGKDYELLQHWSGERRLWTETRRHTYRRKYLAELGGLGENGWVFDVLDPSEAH